MKQLKELLKGHPWQDRILLQETVPSTNDLAKELARQGAPHGTVIFAEAQTAGRGRMGRSFSSPAGQGIYCSVILRPAAKPEELMHLTAVMAEAARRAVAEVTGLGPEIKWVNDLVSGGRKLCGILTQMELKAGTVDFAVVGIGINCKEKKEDFPPELQEMATSLEMERGKPVERAQVAAALLRQIWLASEDLLKNPGPWLDGYREHCITLGKTVQVIGNGDVRQGFAEDITAAGGLIVRFADGSREIVDSGEVSVRGLYGYL